MPEGCTFVVYGPEADPDSAALETPASLAYDSSVAKIGGDSLSLAAYGVVTLADGGAANELSYTWYRKLRGETEWRLVQPSHETGASVYRVGAGEDEKLLTEDDDGSQYKCLIGHNDVAIYTGVIRVDVSEREEASQPVSSEHRSHPVLKRLLNFVGGSGGKAFTLRSGYDVMVDYGMGSADDDPSIEPTPDPGDSTLKPTLDKGSSSAPKGGAAKTLASTGGSNAPLVLGAFSLAVAGAAVLVTAVRNTRRDRKDV